jgi:D-glycero-D-manno-heptose 1,7-bisphosphate phosphatase
MVESDGGLRSAVVGRKACRAVFLDRDGVINAMWYDLEHGTVDSPLNPEQFRLLPGVGEAIRLLKGLGFLCVVVSNQPIVAKGKSTLSSLDAITKKMHSDLAEAEAKLDAVYYCLHHPQAMLKEYRVECECRKPKPGLLIKASQELDIDLARSYMIGDGLTDIQAGCQAECTTILLGGNKCYTCKQIEMMNAKPDFIAGDLIEAAEMIRNRKEQKEVRYEDFYRFS